jgi:hypothetical protein
MRSVCVLLLVGLSLVGCAKSPTELVVLVNSDYLVPAELTEVRARVLTDDGMLVSEHTFALAGTDTVPAVGQDALPFSFAVAPRNGDATLRATIELSAIGAAPDRAVLLTRRAKTGFIEGRSLLLPMFLAKGCAA